MKFGIREVTDIVLKTKYANQQVGSSVYASAYTPVMIVDSAKMTSMENAVATVYAQGGRGNPRLLAWDGDRTATFKFESAIISNDGLSILTGANIATGATKFIRQQHSFSIASGTAATFTATDLSLSAGMTVATNGSNGVTYTLITLDSTGDITAVSTSGFSVTAAGNTFAVSGLTANTDYVVDFYVQAPSRQLQVEAGRFAGYYYIEANTLFRDMDGVDHPAQITVPKGKIKSNFTLTMSPTGDPSTFAFEVDALPDHTIFDTSKKVLYALDISSATGTDLV